MRKIKLIRNTEVENTAAFPSFGESCFPGAFSHNQAIVKIMNLKWPYIIPNQ